MLEAFAFARYMELLAPRQPAVPVTPKTVSLMRKSPRLSARAAAAMVEDGDEDAVAHTAPLVDDASAADEPAQRGAGGHLATSVNSLLQELTTLSQLEQQLENELTVGLGEQGVLPKARATPAAVRCSPRLNKLCSDDGAKENRSYALSAADEYDSYAVALYKLSCLVR